MARKDYMGLALAKGAVIGLYSGFVVTLPESRVATMRLKS